MKSNEAPEKIYLIRNFPNPTALNTTNYHHGKFLNEWYKSKEKAADVEYIRFDIFMKKILEWIKKGGERGDAYIVTEFGEDIIDFVKLAEDLNNYIKKK